MMRKVALLALSLLGLFDAGYLWWVYTSPSHPMVCLGTGCDVVRGSSYAQLLGLPLPAYGAAMYLTLALAIFAQALVSPPLERRLRLLVAGLAGAGFLASLYLTGVEGLVLHAWCAWCVVSALTMTLIFALALLELARPAANFEAAAALVTVRRQSVVFLAALALGVPAFYYLSHLSVEVGAPPPASVEGLTDRLVRPDSHVAGNADAPVTVVEFADFQCPFCGRAEKTSREVRQHLGSKIRFVFRHFPMIKLHPYAEKAAEASECAAAQGKFWEAEEKLYDRQSDLSPAALERYAGELGLDTNRFRQCLESGEMAARVKQDFEDARALGLRAPPTFVVGRRVIEGVPDPADFKRLIEQEVASHGSTPQASEGPSSTPVERRRPNPTSVTAQRASDGQPSETSLPAVGGGIFTQFQAAGMTCSEDEAKKLQPTLIHTPEARQLFETEPVAAFVDVRSAQDFAAKHIRGAVNLPIEEIDKRSGQLRKDRTIVLYESGTAPGDVCASGRAVGRYLLAHGYAPERVRVYQEGLAVWEKEGLPVSP